MVCSSTIQTVASNGVFVLFPSINKNEILFANDELNLYESQNHLNSFDSSDVTASAVDGLSNFPVAKPEFYSLDVSMHQLTGANNRTTTVAIKPYASFNQIADNSKPLSAVQLKAAAFQNHIERMNNGYTAKPQKTIPVAIPNEALSAFSVQSMRFPSKGPLVAPKPTKSKLAAQSSFRHNKSTVSLPSAFSEGVLSFVDDVDPFAIYQQVYKLKPTPGSSKAPLPGLPVDMDLRYDGKLFVPKTRGGPVYTPKRSASLGTVGPADTEQNKISEYEDINFVRKSGETPVQKIPFKYVPSAYADLDHLRKVIAAVSMTGLVPTTNIMNATAITGKTYKPENPYSSVDEIDAALGTTGTERAATPVTAKTYKSENPYSSVDEIDAALGTTGTERTATPVTAKTYIQPGYSSLDEIAAELGSLSNASRIPSREQLVAAGMHSLVHNTPGSQLVVIPKSAVKPPVPSRENRPDKITQESGITVIVPVTETKVNKGKKKGGLFKLFGRSASSDSLVPNIPVSSPVLKKLKAQSDAQSNNSESGTRFGRWLGRLFNRNTPITQEAQAKKTAKKTKKNTSTFYCL